MGIGVGHSGEAAPDGVSAIITDVELAPAMSLISITKMVPDPLQNPPNSFQNVQTPLFTRKRGNQSLFLKCYFQWSNDLLIETVNDAFWIGRRQTQNEMRHASLGIAVEPSAGFSQIRRIDPDLR
jgi:hypothetical protein